MKIADNSESGKSAKAARVARVFVSSTFRDMYAEREVLIKRIFPQLRRLCEQKRVVLSEVDLRWGIPQGEIDEGNLLAICLDEAANCRPFFLCLLGERYGTIIDQYPAEILEKESWLKTHSQKSITELEILHGALNQTGEPIHAFFYFRDAAFTETLPAAERPNFVSEDDDSRLKMNDLKARVRRSGFPVREYAAPPQAGEQILADLSALFERLFPQSELPGDDERENDAHDAFAESRSRVYVGLRRYFDRLDKYVGAKNTLLLVTGEAGIGKSSLLANWARKRAGYEIDFQPEASLSGFFRHKIAEFIKPLTGDEQARDSFLLTHFVGASPQSADRTTMLRRLMIALKNRFRLELDVPERAASVPAAFANFLRAVADRGTIIVVIDGVDQLNDADLSWLPAEIPSNVRLILSATNEEIVREASERRCAVMKIEKLLPPERENFAASYFAQYRKKLDRPLLAVIAAAAPTANPLFLRVVLEELRVFGRRTEELPLLIAQLVGSQNTGELYEKIFARLELDYSAPAPYQPNIVARAMRLLWAAKQGLSESELVELLGSRDNPLPGAIWSPFYLAVKESLLDRAGLYTFFHDEFRRAVEKRYLPRDDEKNAAHLELAEFFAQSDSERRRIEELPWHLASIKAWRELSELLTEPAFLSAAWSANQFDVKSFWAMIEENSPFKMPMAYRFVIDDPARYETCAREVCVLLDDAGHTADALGLSEYLVGAARAAADFGALQTSLSLKAVMLKKIGDLRGALDSFEEQENICRQTSNSPALAASLGNQAVVLRELEQLGEALEKHRQEEEICRRIEDFAGLSASLGNQGVILHERNDFPGALKLLREQERICRQLGDLAGLQKSLGNQAVVLWRENKNSEALKLFKEDENLCRTLGDKPGLQKCLGNRGLVLESIGDYDGALDSYREKESVCRELDDAPALAQALLLQAYLYGEKLRLYRTALPLAEESLRLASQSNSLKMVREIENLLLRLKEKNDPGE